MERGKEVDKISKNASDFEYAFKVQTLRADKLVSVVVPVKQSLLNLEEKYKQFMFSYDQMEKENKRLKNKEKLFDGTTKDGLLK